MFFIRNCERVLTKQPAKNNFNGFVVLLYVQDISKNIGRTLKQQKVKVAYQYKPQQTINSLFPHPKERDDDCTQCNFVYYGQRERSLKIRIAEHKKAVASFDQNSKVASHVHQFSHNMNFAKVRVAWFQIKLPQALLWTQLLETITSHFQKPTKASREHELHGHPRKLHATLL